MMTTTMNLAFTMIMFLEFSLTDAQTRPKVPNEISVRAGSECSDCSCCVNNECDDEFFCTQGCDDGYHGRRCLNKCPTNCIKCTDHINPDIWNTANCTTENCVDGHFSTDTKYQCQDMCPTQSDGIIKCTTCPGNCQNCDSSGICTSCELGYYLNQQLCFRCGENCLSCTSGSYCTECKIGFIGDLCDTCVAQKYGINCDLNCPNNCKNECLKDNGHCINGCKLNFAGPTCGSCMNGFYGSFCQDKCPSKCNANRCTRDTGNCFSCVDNFMGSRCDFCEDGFYLQSITDISICKACLNTCQTCSFPDSCINCKVNFEGDSCDRCISGMYGETCSKTCPGNCKNKSCFRDSGTCNRCFAYFVGPRCENCIYGYHGPFCNLSCPINCNYSTCDRHSGTCSRGCLKNFEGFKCESCIQGKFGDNCTYDCPPRCFNDTCARSTGFCMECKGNFNGPKCEHCIEGKYGANCLQTCSKNCFDNKCNKYDGTCVSCKNGYYGILCERKCLSSCYNSSCDQITGNCRCKAGFSGDKCCLNNSFCDTCGHDGNCNKCINGSYGFFCELTCPVKCLNWRCSRTEGVCMGCPEGYTGNNCSQKIPQTGEYDKSASIGGAIGGVFGLVIIIATVVIALRWRRIICKGTDCSTNEKLYENETSIGNGKIAQIEQEIKDLQKDDDRRKQKISDLIRQLQQLRGDGDVSGEAISSYETLKMYSESEVTGYSTLQVS